MVSEKLKEYPADPDGPKMRAAANAQLALARRDRDELEADRDRILARSAKEELELAQRRTVLEELRGDGYTAETTVAAMETRSVATIPRFVATLSVVNSIANALFTTAAIVFFVSLFGLDVWSMIPGNALPSPTAFVAWTIPYVLGTFLINAVAPALLLGSVFRTPTICADDITRANKVAVLAFAGADAYVVVVAWQGAWLQAVLAALGAVAWLPRHLIAPCAVAVELRLGESSTARRFSI